jgi:integrase
MSRRAVVRVGRVAIWKTCGRRSIIIRGKVFTAAWSVWRFQQRDMAETDGSHEAKLRHFYGAGLSTGAANVTPHTLRQTAATWLMQRGIDPWKAAGFLGMSVEVLLDTYGHHHPEFLREAAAAITTKPNKNAVSGVNSGVDLAAYRETRRKA